MYNFQNHFLFEEITLADYKNEMEKSDKLNFSQKENLIIKK